MAEVNESTTQPEDADGELGPGSTGELTIQVEGVTKQFGPNIAVDDVSFDVSRGEVVGFLGPNGSGKTTTMRLITSFYTPDKGRVMIEGLDNQQHDVETRRFIGYLPENNPVYGDLLVYEYLQFVANLRGLKGAAKRESIAASVEETGVQEVYNRPINQCSKGYRQRVGLAGCILHRPDILIMDEPTAGLDPNQIRDVRTLVRQLRSSKTVLISTHILQEVEAVADHVVIIDEGRIVFDGTPSEMAAGEGLEEAFHRLTRPVPDPAPTPVRPPPRLSGAEGANTAATGPERGGDL
jgi:ABC-2 type transport system ATP-binding protein